MPKVFTEPDSLPQASPFQSPFHLFGDLKLSQRQSINWSSPSNLQSDQTIIDVYTAYIYIYIYLYHICVYVMHKYASIKISLSLCAYTLYPQFQYGRNPPAMAQLPKNSIYLHSDDARVDCFVLP
jgi:hypothetical protein